MHDSQASSTALLIARSMLLAAATPPLDALVQENTVRLTRRFLASAPPARLLDLALRHAWTRKLLLGLERVVLPGIILHYLARKRLIEEHVHAFLGKRPKASWSCSAQDLIPLPGDRAPTARPPPSNSIIRQRSN